MSRNATLDMRRGYALVSIMLNHMPLGFRRQFTLVNFAIFDAAELFVLLSGFLVGMVWVKVEARHGRWTAQKRFLKRAVQVWLALIIGAVLPFAVVRLADVGVGGALQRTDGGKVAGVGQVVERAERAAVEVGAAGARWKCGERQGNPDPYQACVEVKGSGRVVTLSS